MIWTITEFELSISGSSKYILDAIALLGEHDVNIDSVATARVGDRWVIKFLTGSEEEVRRTFIKADLNFKERKVLVVDLPDKPGQWVKAAKSLADKGVGIDSSYLLGQKDNKMRFVFGVDKPDFAFKVAKKIPDLSVE